MYETTVYRGQSEADEPARKAKLSWYVFIALVARLPCDGLAGRHETREALRGVDDLVGDMAFRGGAHVLIVEAWVTTSRMQELW